METAWVEPLNFGGHLNAVTYREEILQPVAILYLHNLEPAPILQDATVRDELGCAGVTNTTML